MSDRFQIGEYWLSLRRGSEKWYATRFNPKTRQTDRTSLGVSDFEEAKEKLAEFVTVRGRMKDEKPKDVLLSTICARYYEGHGQHIASADFQQRALNIWVEYYEDAVVADLTVENQEDFIAWLRRRTDKNGKPWASGYIRRIITAGKAALNYAYRRQEIAAVPYIWSVKETNSDERILSLAETAALFNACKAGDANFMYLVLAYNTMARPTAVLDLAPAQVDLEHRLIDLLPPDREQNKKRRPTVPITNTLLPWLQWCDGETYVNYYGERVANNKKGFAALCERAGVPGVHRKAIRHTMATLMRKKGVDMWEVEGWLGHKMPSTSEKYAKFSPDYLSGGRKAIDDYFNDLQRKVKYPLRLAVKTAKEAEKL